VSRDQPRAQVQPTRRTLPPARATRLAILSASALWLLAGAEYAAHAGDARLEITGGRDSTGQWYNWTVHNLSDSPITYVEFPHYHADTWTVPENWQTDTVNLQGLGVRKESGLLKAWTDDPRLSISPGESAKFTARINRRGALRGTGAAVVRFADGTEVRVGGVDVPCSPSILERVGMPFGLGALLLLYLAFRFAKRRRGTPASDPSAAPSADE